MSTTAISRRTSEDTFLPRHHCPIWALTKTLRKPDEPWVGAFLAGLSGWTLDAFDFFLVVLSLTAIGKDFGQSVPKMLAASWATLALRPVGAFFFGFHFGPFRPPPPAGGEPLFLFSGRAGHRPSRTATYTIYRRACAVRHCDGRVSGAWARRWRWRRCRSAIRGILSGLFQQGYAIGFLLAAGAYFTIFPTHGWRPLFFVGSLPALAAAVFVALRVTESESWKNNKAESFGQLGRTLATHWKLFLYFVIFMMAMHMSSHGTQDMYPTFLEKDWGILGKQKAALTAIGSAWGQSLAGLSIGWISDRIGRRLAMRLALVGASPVHTAVGSFAYTAYA